MPSSRTWYFRMPEPPPQDEHHHHGHGPKLHFWHYVKDEISHVNFYRLHMSYFVFVILISSLIVYGEGLANDPRQINGSRLRYIDALYLCCSAMTTTGLNTVNLGSLTGFQQAVLCILLIIGNIPFVSFFVVVIRRHYFCRKLANIVQNSKSCRRVVEDLEREESATRDAARNQVKNRRPQKVQRAPPDQDRRKPRTIPKKDESQRHFHHSAGWGAFPWPWETQVAERLFHYPFRKLKREWKTQDRSYISFDPDVDERGRFRNLTEHEREELGGVEYRALVALLWLLVIYQVFWYALGILFLVPYAYRRSVQEILKTSQPGDLEPGWWGFFAVVTSFANGGINVLNSNFIPFQTYYYILIMTGLVTVAGNTHFPIFLRFSIWLLSKIVPLNSRLRQTFLFLLHHPRRCFIYLFPARETWYLLAIQFIIDITMWILFELLNLGIPAVDSIPAGTRTICGLFQALGLRTSGSYIILMSSLAPALLIAYLIAMYVSNFPIVMALRQTNTYEERSLGIDKRETSGRGGLARHLRRQLAYDMWFQIFAWFLISIIERSKLMNSQPGFNQFAILFEVTSAYGTVGLSTGVPYDDYSLSGAFQTGSKLVLMAVMLRGRHRGLPLAIDRSILLPGEELMHRMDAEYNELGHWREEEEEEVIRDERESGARELESRNKNGSPSRKRGRPRNNDAEQRNSSRRSSSSSSSSNDDDGPRFEIT
ncbi:potassium transport protein-like protein 1 [Phyllosticta paracitricarpa]|uniref:Potassium transport protein-like protein 1 n=2 Tax=Phyllosticta TaxID=121621 RepID=A0ABR1MHE7_9PEZI